MCAVPMSLSVQGVRRQGGCVLGCVELVAQVGWGSVAELAPCWTLPSGWHLLAASAGFGVPF